MTELPETEAPQRERALEGSEAQGAAPVRRREWAAAQRASRARRLRLRWWWAAVALFALLAALLGWVQASASGRVARGATSLGADLGGLTPAEARARLEQAVERIGLTTARLRTPGGQVLTLPLERLGIGVDIDATVAAAMREGRFELAGISVYYGGGKRISPVVRVDPATYVAGLVVVRDEVDQPAQDAALQLRAGGVSVQPGAPGREVDDVALERSILSALASGRPFDGPVPVVAVQPAVSTADAHAMAGQAARYLQRPLVLRFRDRSVKLKPEVLVTLLSVNKGDGAAGGSPLTFDNPAARGYLRGALASVERAAVDATVEVKRGQAVITPSRNGIEVDLSRLVADMDAAAQRGGLRAVFVKVKTTYPKYTTEALKEMGLSALGSEFTTYFDVGNAARAANIRRCADLVDGTVIPPGREFSLNERVGPRTLNRGFDYAPVIVDGVLRQGVGGGACQFATTLFNAVFFAGLPFGERHPHQFAIDHYPLGRDAAVAWGAADLKFTNDTRRPLMIRCWTSGGSLTVVIVGTTGHSVSYRTGKMRAERQPEHARTNPRVVYDEDLPRGVVSLEQGARGYSITVTRTVKQGGNVVRRDSFTSSYAPRDWIKRIGTRTG